MQSSGRAEDSRSILVGLRHLCTPETSTDSQSNGDAFKAYVYLFESVFSETGAQTAGCAGKALMPDRASIFVRQLAQGSNQTGPRIYSTPRKDHQAYFEMNPPSCSYLI
jgi:hypothetical protein